ncbi:MAG: BrnA antitoxin family protein [Burkholderiales bacterium]|nr:BrnA antitoxin family protein [Burkholderiales bacterium]
MNKMTDAQLKKLAAIPDESIDYSDIPDMSKTKGWEKLYPDANEKTVITDKMMFDALTKALKSEDPDKIPVTLKLDPKIVTFFKQHSKKYQTKINDVLLEFVNQYEKSHGH